MTWPQIELAFHFAQREELRRIKRQAFEVREAFMPVLEAIYGRK